MFILTDKELTRLTNRTSQHHEMTLTYCLGNPHYGIVARNQWAHMLAGSSFRPGQQAGRDGIDEGGASPRPCGFRTELQYYTGAELSSL